MSYVFTNADNQATIWSPALQTGTLFIAVCDAVAASLDTPHGLEAMAADYITVNSAAFSHFIAVWLQAYEASTNDILRMAWQPYLLLSLALLQRMDKPVVPASDTARTLATDAAALLRHMPV